jgi:spore coat polysaccharide biosynthesis protein SpsF (cytidylyltransferase family)
MLVFCAPTVRAQSQPVSTELAQVQKKAIAAAAEVHPVAMVRMDVDPSAQLERVQIANAFRERQLALRRDTEKLLSLAAELKQNVDKTSPNILSMDVIKKAQEIEKLAKSVKDKMREAY